MKRARIDSSRQTGKSADGVPRLLVSVRSAEEAIEALEGGADIIDIKEPGAGSLGEADAHARQAVVRSVAGAAPISAALGELRTRGRDWTLEHQRGISLYKLGLSHTREEDWRGMLERARGLVRAASGEEADLVAVAYADWERASSPEPESLLEYAIERGFSHFLVDTWDKEAGALPVHVGWSEIAVLAGRARRRGVRFVAAGKLTAEQLPAAAAAGVDVIAVRGAATAGARTASVERRAVRNLRRCLREVLRTG